VSDLVTLDRFVFLADAEVARATLEAAGIDAMLVNDSSKPTEGVLLRVHADDVESAREVLSAPMEIELEELDALENEEHCPRCFSIEIYPAESRGRANARFAVIALAILAGLELSTAALRWMGHEVNATIVNVIGGLTIIAFFGAVLVYAAAGPKRCRNCGLEWRGTPRTN
jgi:hypothetical protein